MENTPYLYDTLLGARGQHSKWLDARLRQTLAWMIFGLISSKTGLFANIEARAKAL